MFEFMAENPWWTAVYLCIIGYTLATCAYFMQRGFVQVIRHEKHGYNVDCDGVDMSRTKDAD